MNKKVIALLIVSTLLAGCADAIPEPSDVYDEDRGVDKAWTTLTGNFTLVFDNTTNQTLLEAPNLMLETNKTYGLLEVQRFNYTAEHLSFEVVNNSVRFYNYSFHMNGYLSQNGVVFYDGLAPDFGDATLHFAKFPFDITVNYDITYRVWDGRE